MKAVKFLVVLFFLYAFYDFYLGPREMGDLEYGLYPYILMFGNVIGLVMYVLIPLKLFKWAKSKLTASVA